ncbi:hypothetical protein PAXINDRAFT_99709 [Paxillus involutus ATCC 200175]|uniref:Ankyrin n=1 Tax=Paxillus involutus ATCC 200175 TaxID=664439 RepID=A0A0C9TY81_PAXIN|nr:hypothetical protein PAXINDRAFT_99709 [Paxillus involutus ATCC 200175]
MMQMLIDKGADVDVRTFNGDSVLHLAIKCHIDRPSHQAHHARITHLNAEFVETVKILIDSGYNPAVCNSYGQTPLHVAVIDAHVSVVKSLLSLDFPLPPDILLTAARARNVQAEMIKILIDKRADVHAHTSGGNSVLHVTIGRHIGLELASRSSLLETVKILVDSGCDPAASNSRHETPLHIAAIQGHVSIMEYLLSLDTPLPLDILPYTAARARHMKAEMINILIDKGADVHARTRGGENALDVTYHQGIELESRDILETVKILVDSGCDPAASNSRHETLLHIATMKGHVSIMEYLLSLGVPLPPDILLTVAREPRTCKQR